MSNKNDNQIMNTLHEIQGTLKEHGGILNEHGKILNVHGKKLDKHEERLSSVEKTCTKLVSIVVQNTTDIREIKENMMTKADKDEILSVISEFAGRTHSNEEQITIGTHQLRRTNNRVDKIEADVKRIKPLVGLR